MTMKETIAILQTQNKEQTKAIDRLTDVMSKHDETSNIYRQKTVVNERSIKWLAVAIIAIISYLTGIQIF